MTIPFAGGTNLNVDLRAKRERPDRIIGLGEVAELKGMEFDKDRIVIGGATTVSDLLRSAEVAEPAPSLVESARLFAGPHGTQHGHRRRQHRVRLAAQCGYCTPGIIAAAKVGLAWMDENGVINIRVSTQVIEHFRPIADAIGAPHNRVRIRGALVGGGFGGKEDLTVEVYLALLALRTRRPVRLEYTREDSFVGHGKRHLFVMTYRTGVTRDGRITALDVEMVADSGAYVFLSPYVVLYALGQIAVEVLGVTLDNVVIYNSDSAVTPLAGTTTATRALYMTGNAVKQAAEAVRARLAERAAREFGVAAGDIEMAFNEVFVTDRPEKSIPLVELVRLCGAEGIHRSELAMFRAPFGNFLDPETGQGQAHPDYAYGAHAVEVSVDVDTGEVAVLKSVAAHDVGQCINPAAVEGQIQGGAQNDQGFALSEEMLYEEVRLVTPSFSEYLMPTAMDMPKVECILLESRSGVGPFGAKGIGEPAITPVAPAIANAVADAIGVRVFEMPITPERVVMAMKHHDAAG